MTDMSGFVVVVVRSVQITDSSIDVYQACLGEEEGVVQSVPITASLIDV